MAPELRAQKTQLTLSACKRDNGRKKKKKKKLGETFEGWCLEATGRFRFTLLGRNAACRKCKLTTSGHSEHCTRELQQRAASSGYRRGVGGLGQSQWRRAVNDPKPVTGKKKFNTALVAVTDPDPSNRLRMERRGTCI